MKTLVLTWGLLISMGISYAQTCNDGFESNSFAGWQGATGTNNGSYSITITSTGFPASNFGIESAATSTIICSNSNTNTNVYEPLPAPGFGQYTARLGQYNMSGAVVEMMTYSFVPTVADSNFLYTYTTYLQAPGHSAVNNPYFIVKMLDAAGNVIPGSLYMYQTGTFSTLGFDTSACNPMLLFKGWTIRGVNLSAYVGQTVTLVAINSDCALSGHYAYSYIDIDCDGVLQVPAGSNMVLSAKSEEGATYLWNTGATTPTIMIASPVPNSIYTCKVTLSSAYSNYSFNVTYKIVSPTSVSNNAEMLYSKIYPNPASDVLYLKDIHSLKIINTLGQVVKHSVFKEKERDNAINIADLPEGLYIVEYRDTNNAVHFDKMMISW